VYLEILKTFLSGHHLQGSLSDLVFLALVCQIGHLDYLIQKLVHMKGSMAHILHLGLYHHNSHTHRPHRDWNNSPTGQESERHLAKRKQKKEVFFSLVKILLLCGWFSRF